MWAKRMAGLGLIGLLLSGFMPGADVKPDAPEPASGAPLNGVIVISDDGGLEEESPAVVYHANRDEYLVVWYNDRTGNDDIRAQRLSPWGSLIGGPFYISAGAGHERRYPKVAYNSREDQYLVVWENYSASEGYSIRGRRVSGQGLVLDANDLIIRSAGLTNYSPLNPAVGYAYTSNKYLVVWEETWHPMPISKDILGQKVLPNGALDGGVITISDDTGAGDYRTVPDLDYNRGRNEYLVAWQQLDHSAGITDIFARRVTGDGVALNPPAIQIAWYTVSSSNPTVAAIPIFPDGQYLVGFELQYAPGDKDISGRWVASDGTLQGLGEYLGGSNQNEVLPALAGSETPARYLGVWVRQSGSGSSFDEIYGRTLSIVPDTLDPEKFFDGTAASHPDAAAGEGGDFLAVYQDIKSSGTNGIFGILWGNRAFLPMMKNP